MNLHKKTRAGNEWKFGQKNIFCMNSVVIFFAQMFLGSLHISSIQARRDTYGGSVLVRRQINGLFTWTVFFSVGCDSRIRHRTKYRIIPIFGYGCRIRHRKSLSM
jgi:hypothetical protein